MIMDESINTNSIRILCPLCKDECIYYGGSNIVSTGRILLSISEASKKP